LQDFKTWSSSSGSLPGKSELDVYFEEESMQLEEENSEDFEVLLSWKLNAKKYPTLSIMARDIHSIPITTVASESSFSIGGRILTKYRSSTLPEHVQMLISAALASAFQLFWGVFLVCVYFRPLNRLWFSSYVFYEKTTRKDVLMK